LFPLINFGKRKNPILRVESTVRPMMRPNPSETTTGANRDPSGVYTYKFREPLCETRFNCACGWDVDNDCNGGWTCFILGKHEGQHVATVVNGVLHGSKKCVGVN
jgi:hypothetical protein